MKNEFKIYDRTPIDNTYKKPVRIVNVGTHNDPATDEDVRIVKEFLESFGKRITIEYVDESNIERTVERKYKD